MPDSSRSASTRQTAEQARQASREVRRQRSRDIAHNSYAPPQVIGIVDMDDGTLSREAARNDLEVEIPAWLLLPREDEMATVFLQLSITRDEDSEYNDVGAGVEVIGPVDRDADFPLRLTLPKELFGEGQLWLRYRIVDDIGDNPSDSLALISDLTPPHHSGDADAQLEPLVLPQPVIDDDYLDANPTGLTATIPDYANFAAKDRYEVFYFDHYPDEQDDFSNPAHEGEVDATDPSVLIPKAIIERHADGKYYLAYFLIDKAGNRSRVSLATPLNVTLGALPDQLQPPVVPLALGDGTIDLKDAIEGVTVEILEYQNSKVDDHIVVTWGTTALIPHPIGGRPFPISIHVPNPTLRSEYTQGDSPQTTPVSYVIKRGEVSFGPQRIDVEVDFSIVGPERPDPDPDWPDPINIEIAPPTVRGKHSQTDNQLTRADAHEDAELIFELYEGAENGQVVDFYWNGKRIEESQHVIDLSQGSPLTIVVPWPYIQEANNNSQLPVHYTVRKDDASSNEQQSVVQLVDVNAIIVVLPSATYQGINTANWLVCDSLRDPSAPGSPLALRVDIPDLSAFLQPGDTVKLYWEPWVGDRDADGTVPIGGAEKSTEIPLDADNITGFTWRVEPYEDHLLPAFDVLRARARVRYSKLDDDDLSSEWAVQRMSVVEGNGSCTIP